MNKIILAAAIATLSSVAAFADAGSAGVDRNPERQIMNDARLGPAAREFTMRDRPATPAPRAVSETPTGSLTYFTAF